MCFLLQDWGYFKELVRWTNQQDISEPLQSEGLIKLQTFIYTWNQFQEGWELYILYCMSDAGWKGVAHVGWGFQAPKQTYSMNNQIQNHRIVEITDK